MSNILHELRKDLAKKDAKQVLLLDNEPTDDITKATGLKLSNGETFALESDTEFIIESKPITLKAAYYTYLNRELPAAEFVTDSQAKNIKTLAFIERNDLINWLEDPSAESNFIKSSSTKTSGKVSEPTSDDAMDIDDSLLDSILSHERNLLDHNTALRGFKPVDFSNVARECEIKIVKQLKRKGAVDAKASDKDSNSKKRRQNPIIIISPAASALISVTNIKSFFEDSFFVDPNSTDEKDQQYLSPPGDIRNVTHTFPRIGKQTFLIVNSTDKFTKPEYWDRVVAVFTTGQLWQFKNYKWSTPGELFQKIKGYYFYFNKDVIPQQVKDWNVDRIAIDKHKRFKDAEVLNHFWDSLEKSMIAKGWN